MAYRYALWSGYQLSQADFKELIESIPSSSTYHDDRRTAEEPDVGFFYYISFYNHWKNRLPLELRKLVPPMLCECYILFRSLFRL